MDQPLNNVLRCQQFSRDVLLSLFDKTAYFGERGYDSVRTRSDIKDAKLVLVGLEQSKRTRTSFCSAMESLGGKVVGVGGGKEFSEFRETDPVQAAVVYAGFGTLLAVRTEEEGQAEEIASLVSIPVINAGDGNLGQHPTQAIADVYTMRRALGTLDGISVTICGDITGRAPRSMCYTLSKFPIQKLTFVSPGYKLHEGLAAHLKEHNISYVETSDFEEGIEGADALYMTALDPRDFARTSQFSLSEQNLPLLGGTVVLHPLPFGKEIDLPLAQQVEDPRFLHLSKQVWCGVSLRAALLERLI